jgi:hypothetical protein
MTKISRNSEVETFSKLRKTVSNEKKEMFVSENKPTKCPRGFGDIKKFNDDNSVSERCLSCHLIIECFSETPQTVEPLI